MSSKTYQVTLRTLGPVHIGTGTTLTKQEYIFDKNNKLIHIVNGRKLVNYLKRNNKLEDYIQFFSKPEQQTNLGSFLQENEIIEDDWDQFVQYSVPIIYEESQKVNAISPFMRDGLNTAFIPGSTLKGALRTILAGELRDRETNLLFKNIRISDSEPLDDQQLVIYQKIDVNKKVKPIPLFRECINANEKVTTLLTIENDAITIEEIEAKISEHYDHYRTKWLDGFKSLKGGASFFEQEDEATQKLFEDDARIILLGGGVGLASKTIHYQKYDRETAREHLFELLQRRSRHIYGKFDVIPNNVPIALKLTKSNETNQWFMFGACEITFEEI